MASSEDKQEELGGDFEPTLKNIIEQTSLNWIFVGGKGGVGKTTTSSALAVQLSKHRDSVLLISTDPAHNLSDVFSQKFSKTPQLVQGFPNLYAMEIEPTIELDQMQDVIGSASESTFLQQLPSMLPGIDEMMSFAEMMKFVQNMDFSVIVFDTAPTGHTLRLLSFPSSLDTAIEKLLQIRNKFTGLFESMSGMVGSNLPPPEVLFSKVEEIKRITQTIDRQFKNPDLTTFIGVCIPEFLSLYETERLVQELTRFEIDVHNIVVNQVLYPTGECRKCAARVRMQTKYLTQIEELYDDFHVVKMPLLDEEVRGRDSVLEFGRYLMSPYQGPSADADTDPAASRQ